MRRALVTAREMLRGTVCQCGDTTSEHALASLKPSNHLKVTYGGCLVEDCACEKFTPVRFRVEPGR
jgi:hypothetical protein